MIQYFIDPLDDTPYRLADITIDSLLLPLPLSAVAILSTPADTTNDSFSVFLPTPHAVRWTNTGSRHSTTTTRSMECNATHEFEERIADNTSRSLV